MLRGNVGLKVRELIHQTCQAFEIKILKGFVSKDHFHLFIFAPPTLRSHRVKLSEEKIKSLELAI